MRLPRGGPRCDEEPVNYTQAYKSLRGWKFSASVARTALDTAHETGNFLLPDGPNITYTEKDGFKFDFDQS